MNDDIMGFPIDEWRPAATKAGINLDDQNDPRIKRMPPIGFKAEVPDFIKTLAASMKPAETDKDVHTEHCCSQHGCKYGQASCTVSPRGSFVYKVPTIKRQSHMCEQCDDELREGGLELAYLLNKMYDQGFEEGRSVGHSER